MVGESPLASATSNTPARYHLDAMWDEDPINWCLEEGLWTFATRTMEWNYNPALEPDFGYKYSFTKPTDYRRTVALCTDSFFKTPLVEYADENGNWYCDLETIYLKYVSNDSAYGKDYSLWTEKFRDCVATKMAAGLCYGLSKSQTTTDRLEKKLEDAIKASRNLDAMNQPTRFSPPGTWVRSRRSNSRGRSYFGPGE